MNSPAPKGRPQKAKNQHPKRAGRREPELFSDRYSWPLFRRACDRFLTDRGLTPN
ncbi:MAG: hypothetical protein JWO82_1661 [Akkermansiaceae bacterium]|nr:hypothetical protein [Akkermansiaceae bacterium]